MRRAQTLIGLAAGLAFALPASAAALAPRVTVALFGDSVVEGYTIPNYLTGSLGPQLAAALGRHGFARGGIGYVAPNPIRWTFNSYDFQTPTLYGPSMPPATLATAAVAPLPLPKYSETIPAGGWLLLGDGDQTGQDGLSGYGALADSPSATATVPVGDPEVAILYQGGPRAGPFTVTAGPMRWTITPTARSGPTETWLAMPAGVRRLTVRGPSTGGLVFEGAIERRPRASRVQVEMEDLGHAGQPPWTGLTPPTVAGLAEQAFDISVFADAYIPELAATTPGMAKGTVISYTQGLTQRARLARADGGLCLIADPTPMQNVPPSVITRFAGLDRQIASSVGCSYSGVLTHAWHTASSIDRGWTLLDGIHPSAKGYRRMAALLEPVMASLVRERAQGG